MQGLESQHLVVVIDNLPETHERRWLGGLSPRHLFSFKYGVGSRRLPALAGRSVTVMFRPFGDVDQTVTTAHSQAWVDLCLASGADSFELLIDHSASARDRTGPPGDDDPDQSSSIGGIAATDNPVTPETTSGSPSLTPTNDAGETPAQPPTSRLKSPRRAGWARLPRVCGHARPAPRRAAVTLALTLGALAVLVAAACALALIIRRVIDQRWAVAGLGVALLVAALSTWWWWATRRGDRVDGGRLRPRGWLSARCDSDVVTAVDAPALAGELSQCV